MEMGDDSTFGACGNTEWIFVLFIVNSEVFIPPKFVENFNRTEYDCSQK